MTIVAGQNVDPADFITFAERNATPASDTGRVPQFEADGRLHGFFTRNGFVPNAGETINGATLPVPVYQDKADNEVYACDANDTNKIKFLGFAISNSTNGNAIAVQGSGVVAGFTALDEGQKYYVQDTAGTIGTTPGTQEILVGIAISTTELLIQKGTMRAAGDGSSLGTASGSLAVTTGFRPSKIRIFANTAGSNNQKSSLDFTYVNGQTYSVAECWEPGVARTVDGTDRLYGVSTASYMTFTITSITDTGFTITWTETGTFNPTTSYFKWEAEGEL
jgi:hypothetical protein